MVHEGGMGLYMKEVPALTRNFGGRGEQGQGHGQNGGSEQ